MKPTVDEAKILFGFLAGIFDVTRPFEVIVYGYTEVLNRVTWGNQMVADINVDWNGVTRASYREQFGLRVVCSEAM